VLKLKDDVPAQMLVTYLNTCIDLITRFAMSDLQSYCLSALIQSGFKFHALAVFKLITISALMPLTLLEDGSFEMNPALEIAKAVLEYSISQLDDLSTFEELLFYMHSVNLESKQSIASLLTSAERQLFAD
jgi:hypothetical protein